MIKKQNDISQVQKNSCYYRVTATLLNSWQRIWDAKDRVFSSDNDNMSYEDKVDLEREKATKEFISLLNREPTPDNEYMKRGREYEEKVCNGLDDEFSPIVEKGAFQVTLTKKVIINNTPILLYGVLDVLKAGRIMDIKRVVKYSSGKYKNSHQHSMYLYLAPESYDFTYLICDDKGNHYYENYERQNCEDILVVVSQFIDYLKSNDLYDTFIQNWASKN